MRLELQNQEHFIFAGRVMAVAHHYKTMKALAARFGVTVFQMRYRLEKASKLKEVNAVIKRARSNTSPEIK